MSDVGDGSGVNEDDAQAWLGGRKPEAPADLRERLAEAVARQSPDAGCADALMQAGQAALDAAVRRPGRVREAAYTLLVADALVTYACEAALESDGPMEALGHIVEVGRTR